MKYSSLDDFFCDLIGRFSDVVQEIYSNISKEKKGLLLNLDANFDFQISFLEALNGTNKPSSKE